MLEDRHGAGRPSTAAASRRATGTPLATWLIAGRAGGRQVRQPGGGPPALRRIRAHHHPSRGRGGPRRFRPGHALLRQQRRALRPGGAGRDPSLPGGTAEQVTEQLLDTDPARARTTAREHLANYLGLPNYTHNLLRLGYTEADFRDGGSDRLVDASVGWGDVAAACRRVAEHRVAGADHVCIQVLGGDRTHLPRKEWRALADALELT